MDAQASVRATRDLVNHFVSLVLAYLLRDLSTRLTMAQPNTNPATWGISNRLTPKLAAAGFTAVPTTLLEHYASLKITTAEAMFIIQLLSHKWSKRNPFPKFSRLANRMGMTETAVRSHARNLERKNLLKRIPRAGRSNEFDLSPLFLQLEAKIASSTPGTEDADPFADQ